MQYLITPQSPARANYKITVCSICPRNMQLPRTHGQAGDSRAGSKINML